MTLGDLRRELALYLGLDATVSDGLLALWDEHLLNRAADMLANEYKIPRGEAIYTADQLTAPVTLPADALEVLRVIAPTDVALPVIEAEDFNLVPDGPVPPIVALHGGGVVVNYSQRPATLTYLAPPLRELPPQIKVVYRAGYARMAAEGDQPWNGNYPDYHRLIALRAALDALLRLSPGAEGDGEVTLRYRRSLEEYQALATLFRNELDRGMYVARPNVVSGMYRRRRYA